MVYTQETFEYKIGCILHDIFQHQVPQWCIHKVVDGINTNMTNKQAGDVAWLVFRESRRKEDRDNWLIWEDSLPPLGKRLLDVLFEYHTQLGYL